MEITNFPSSNECNPYVFLCRFCEFYANPYCKLAQDLAWDVRYLVECPAMEIQTVESGTSVAGKRTANTPNKRGVVYRIGWRDGDVGRLIRFAP